MAECKGGIELVQAICIIVFWKAPSDGSGWLKIGFAVRLGFSLRLHFRRTGPLPGDPHDAWVVLDRERTWFNLTCKSPAHICHGSDSQLDPHRRF